jgi:hypothetical protein
METGLFLWALGDCDSRPAGGCGASGLAACCCEPLKGVENLSSLGCLIPAFELDLGWRGCDLFRGLGWAGDVA